MNKCDLCGHEESSFVCKPIGTELGATVRVCNACGLLFSVYGKKNDIKKRSLTGNASFGNIRYGKGFDVPEGMRLLGLIDRKFESALDIGAGRGEFSRALLEKHQDIFLTMIEPDKRVIGDLPDATLIKKRVENIKRIGQRFDLIVMNHTLEHLDSPRETLFKLRDWLTADGTLLIVVPNAEVQINRDDIVEEVFIDKHRFHFTPRTLKKLLTICGYTWTMFTKEESIFMLCHRDTNLPKGIVDYEARLGRNREKMQNVVDAIHKMENVIIWGAGRLFHLMLDFGLDRDLIYDVVDEFMPYDVRKKFGISKPLWDNRRFTIVIASREFEAEITERAKEFYERATVVPWRELL